MSKGSRVYLRDSLHQKVYDLAESYGLTVSALISIIVIRFMKDPLIDKTSLITGLEPSDFNNNN